MLTENTRNAFLCIELIDESRKIDFENALKELADLVNKNLGGTSKVKIKLDKTASSFILMY